MPEREQRTAASVASGALVGVFRTTKRRAAYVQSLGPGQRTRVGLSDGSRYARDGDIVRMSITGQNRRGPVGRIRPCAFCRGRAKAKRRRRFDGHAKRWRTGMKAGGRANSCRSTT